MLPFFNSIQKDLEQLQENIDKEFKLKSGRVPELVSLDLQDLDHYIRPAVLLSVLKAYCPIDQQAVMIGTVIQFIYLATKVHEIVRDYDQDVDYKFPVLVGDYLYGQFFLYLCKAKALKYLNPLSKIICEIHEGGILRYQAEKNGTDYDKLAVLEKENAGLFAVACKIGAELGGASLDEQEIFWQLGKKLGVGIAALARGMSKHVARCALQEARDILNSLPVKVSSLDGLMTYLTGQMT